MINCPYFKENNVCEVASKLVGLQVVIPGKNVERTCNHCSSHTYPRQPNSITASIALAAVRNQKPDHYSTALIELQEYLEIIELRDGPGRMLHELLLERGYEMIPGCKCLSMMYKMNRLGVDWCRSDEGRKEIVDAMVKEWQNRHWIISKIIPDNFLRNGVLGHEGANDMLTLAIVRWERKISEQ